MEVDMKLLQAGEKIRSHLLQDKVLLETDCLHLLQSLHKKTELRKARKLKISLLTFIFQPGYTRKQLLHLTCMLTFLFALEMPVKDREMPVKDRSIKQNRSMLRRKMSLLQTTWMRFHSISCSFEEQKANLSLGDR